MSCQVMYMTTSEHTYPQRQLDIRDLGTEIVPLFGRRVDPRALHLGRFVGVCTDCTRINPIMSDVSGTNPDEADAHARLVHEFKNQLAVIIGFCDLLLRELPAEDPHRSDVEQMQKAGQQAVDMLPRLAGGAR